MRVKQTKGKDGTTTTPSLRKEWDTSPVDGDSSTACIHEYALEAVVQAMVEPQGLERASTAANASQLEQHLRTEVGVSSLRADSVPSNWRRPADRRCRPEDQQFPEGAGMHRSENQQVPKTVESSPRTDSPAPKDWSLTQEPTQRSAASTLNCNGMFEEARENSRTLAPPYGEPVVDGLPSQQSTFGTTDRLAAEAQAGSQGCNDTLSETLKGDGCR